MDEFERHTLLDQAADALDRGDYVRALAIADQLAAENPDDLRLRGLRTRALLAAADYPAALAEAGRLIELAGEDDESLLLLARAAWRSGKLSLAQHSFEKAIKSARRQAALLAEYAWFMAQVRGPKLAVTAARDAIDADPKSPRAWAALGVAQHRLHQATDAEASLSQALKLDPHDVDAQAALLLVFHNRRQDSKALALASLIEEQAGTEDVVASVRDEAKQRQVAKLLVERQAMPHREPAHSSRPWWAWVAAAALMWALGVLLLQPQWPMMVLSGLVLLVLLVTLRRLFE